MYDLLLEVAEPSGPYLLLAAEVQFAEMPAVMVLATGVKAKYPSQLLLLAPSLRPFIDCIVLDAGAPTFQLKIPPLCSIIAFLI